jgi:hypothetical protein
MTDTVLKCPKCGTEVPLTESLAAPMVAAVRMEMQADIDAANIRADKIAASIGEAVARDRNATKAAVLIESKAAVADELRVAEQNAAAAEAEMAKMRNALTYAQEAQVAAIKHERELADKERELDLTVERRLSMEVVAIRARAQNDAAEEYKLQLMQSEHSARELREQIEDLKRKAQETSTRIQGEVQELDLEARLHEAFPFDEITEVAKGVHGADCSQLVRSTSGAACGIILYESKRTKNWSPGWLPKLREDTRAAKAHIAVLVTQAMPGDMEGFDSIDNVWVVQPKFAIPLATAMRETLVRVHAASQAQDGMKSKAEEVYSYITGPQFKHRVESLVEAFTALREDLEAEKRATLRQWAKRETQIERVVGSTTGMFGDLQGISGKALPDATGLQLEGGGE